MLVKIVWKESGDELTFSPCFPDLLVYYVDQLNQHNANCFKLKYSKFDYQTYTNLQQNLASIAKVAHRIPFEISNWHGDILDQNYLNLVHSQWVKTGILHPKIILLLRHWNLDQPYRDINLNLHLLEKSFEYQFANYDVDPFQVDNIFGRDILQFNFANLWMKFDNLGRATWDKFRNFDENVDAFDTNDFQMLGGMIYLNLDRPLTITPPKEYVDWCNQHRVPVTGVRCNLGNIVDLEKNLTSIRKILIRNSHEQSNQFFFELCAQ